MSKTVDGVVITKGMRVWVHKTQLRKREPLHGRLRVHVGNRIDYVPLQVWATKSARRLYRGDCALELIGGSNILAYADPLHVYSYDPMVGKAPDVVVSTQDTLKAHCAKVLGEISEKSGYTEAEIRAFVELAGE